MKAIVLPAQVRVICAGARAGSCQGPLAHQGLRQLLRHDDRATACPPHPCFLCRTATSLWCSRPTASTVLFWPPRLLLSCPAPVSAVRCHAAPPLSRPPWHSHHVCAAPATTGLWDVINSQEVVRIVRKELGKGLSPQVGGRRGWGVWGAGRACCAALRLLLVELATKGRPSCCRCRRWRPSRGAALLLPLLLRNLPPPLSANRRRTWRQSSATLRSSGTQQTTWRSSW